MTKKAVFFYLFIQVFMANIFAQKYTVHFFLSDGCPMCIGYTGTMNKLFDEYSNKEIRFEGIFPNFYVTDSLIQVFRENHDIKFNLQKDINEKYLNTFQATITPEVVFVDNNENILYRGQIDDAYYKPGKRKGIVSKHYLKDAIETILAGKKPILAETKPIGCVIVKN
jgi:thiol-disulfide isomerase/thioredoxin